MDELHRNILKQNRTNLLKELYDIPKLCDLLQEREILTENMVQDINAEKTQIKQGRKLLDIIPRRGPFAFDIFCNVLVKTGQRHAAELLKPELKNSGVKALPPEGENKMSETKLTSHSQGNKQNPRHPSYPVPVQLPVDKEIVKFTAYNKEGKTGGLQDQPLLGGKNKTSASSQPTTPNDESYQPAIGRQGSREVTKHFLPEDEERLNSFPAAVKGWPDELELTMSQDSYDVEPCSEDDIDHILSLGTQVYDMDSGKVKRALLINNSDFGEKYAKRVFSQRDYLRLHGVLKSAGFTFALAGDVTKEKLMQYLERERELKGKKSLSVFMLIIMSYGGEGTVMCVDGQSVKVEDIINMFSSKMCPLMQGVPKVFLLQALGTLIKDCFDGGDASENKYKSQESYQPEAESDSSREVTTTYHPEEEQHQVTAPEDVLHNMARIRLDNPSNAKDNAYSPETAAYKGGNVEADRTEVDTKASLHTSQSEDSLSDPLKLEDKADMLVAMATSPDVNNAQYSSLFLLGLSYLIRKHARSDNFVTLLKGVNHLKLADDSTSPVKLCEFKDSLTKKLFLMPGYKGRPGTSGNFATGGKGDSS